MDLRLHTATPVCLHSLGIFPLAPLQCGEHLIILWPWQEQKVSTGNHCLSKSALFRRLGAEHRTLSNHLKCW